MEIIPTRLSDEKVEVFCKAAASDPLVFGAPDLDYEFTIIIDRTDPSQPVYSHTGSHDGFPDYEVFINHKLIFGFDAVANNQTAISLEPPMEWDVDETNPNNINQPLP